jgi:2-polyprenyl-3-methyl-5-hydroxy-6-metoxy-1,4-benzoquinol methylase
MSRKEHWESIYSARSDSEVSWTQVDPRTSLALIHHVLPGGAVIDVGGGTSVLGQRLLEQGYAVAVLDISQAALDRARQRLGDKAAEVRWIVADVTAIEEVGQFDVWHDRAVFHFLTDAGDRSKYIALAERTVRVGGHLIIGTFALDGPEKCSGLPVERYDGRKLAEPFGDGFVLKKEIAETHVTPWGKPQRFTYAVLQRVS